MNRIIAKCLGLIAGLCVSAGAVSASAQCSNINGCNQATTHWGGLSPGVAPTGKIGVGMYWEPGSARYYPILCRWDASTSSWWHVAVDSKAYTTAQLTTDTSICLGNNATEFVRFDASKTCKTSAVTSVTAVPFDDNGKKFIMSGMDGDDLFDLINASNSGEGAICGGKGNDRIYGGVEDQYISGSAGNDLLHGSYGHDDIRGGVDDDVIYHGTGEGNDIIRGEDNNDCVRITSGADNDTNCGAQSDWYQTTGIAAPPSCETPVASCCAVSSAC